MDHTVIDEVVEDTLLFVSANHIKRFASLPPQIQDKIREKIRHSLQNHHTQFLEKYGAQKIREKSQIQRASRSQSYANQLEDLGGFGDLLERFNMYGTEVLSKDPGDWLEEEEEETGLIETPRREAPQASRGWEMSNLNPGALLINDHASEVSVLSDGQIKMDLTSSREGLFSSLGCLSVMGVFVFAFIGLGDIATLSFFAAIYFWASFFRTDVYLLVNCNDQMVYYHKQYKQKVELIPHLPFSHIAYVAITAAFHQSKENSWWTYKTVAITMDGEVIELGDEQKSNFVDAYQFTESLAAVMGVPFYAEVEPMQQLEVYGSGSRLKIEYIEAG